MQIKIFTDSDEERLQTAINKWLASQKDISVSDVLQSESLSEGSWSLTITLVYIGGK